MIKGVDISIIQGAVDFAALAASGVEFVVIRCGVGNGGIDKFYTQNVAKAKTVGLKVAAYHFIYPLPPLIINGVDTQPLRDPVKQAQYHYNAAGGEIACIDCEWPAPEDWGKWGCNSVQLNQWMLTYLREYERLSGHKPLIYTYPYWAANVGFEPAFTQYSLWIASYQANPAIPHPWSDWVLWQNTGGGGHLPTTGVAVDTDLAKDLSLWETVVTPITQPFPTHQPDPPIDPNTSITPTPIPIPVPVVPVPPPVVVQPQPPPSDPNKIVVPPSIQRDVGIISGLIRAFINLFKEEFPKL